VLARSSPSVSQQLPLTQQLRHWTLAVIFWAEVLSRFRFSQLQFRAWWSYDTTNSGVVTPNDYIFVNSDLTVGSSAWYYNSVTKFMFRSVNGAPGSQITGTYSGIGAGAFVVYNNDSGLDALAPSTFFSDGLTGIAPGGYRLIGASIYFICFGRILGSNVLPDITNGGAPFSDFFESPPPGGYAGALFSATYQPMSDGSDVTIYATLTTVAVPEPSTWAMILVGFAGLGVAGYRTTKGARTVWLTNSTLDAWRYRPR
jgi:hypothetical protein